MRKHEEVIGDIHSFVAANPLGAERLLAFMDDYGMHDLRALAAVVQSRAERPCATPSARCRTASIVPEIWNNPLRRAAALSVEDHRRRASGSSSISPARRRSSRRAG